MEIYCQECTNIFTGKSYIRLLRHGYFYNNDSLLSMAEKYFGNKKLSDTSKDFLIQAAVLEPDEEGNNLIVFNKAKYPDLYVKDVVVASCSAPFYFPPYKIENKEYVDGGVFANDPTFVCFTYFA